MNIACALLEALKVLWRSLWYRIVEVSPPDLLWKKKRWDDITCYIHILHHQRYDQNVYAGLCVAFFAMLPRVSPARSTSKKREALKDLNHFCRMENLPKFTGEAYEITV